MTWTKSRATRRMFLGGAGALVALPALEWFHAREARSDELDSGAPLRFLVYFLPNGRVPGNWIPPEQGADFSFPFTLAPLAALKADLLCLSNLDHVAGRQATGTGDHAKGTGTILNSAPFPNGNLHGDISFDQLLVQRLKPKTRFASLQWGAGEPMACDFAASCSYTQAISWAGPQQPLAPTISPLTAFNQLFAGTDEGSTTEEQERRRQSLASVLDYVLDDADHFQKKLGKSDQAKLDEYLTSVRELEKRITEPAGESCDSGPAPAAGLDYEHRVYAFNDLIVLALRCNQTQVLTFMIENGLSGRTHDFVQSYGGHHALTHGGAGVAPELARLEEWEAKMAADVATKLKNAIDIDGTSVLDNTAMLLLPDMGMGGSHDHTNLAPVLVGKCGGALVPGKAIHYPATQLPLGNLYVSLLHAFDVNQDTFGIDGVAPLAGLTG
ncbi:MAG: DUF1552 domain-containing protein [Polyangiaceae bacterium]